MSFDPKEVLFVGRGTSTVCYYRCLLPAMSLGADWCGVVGTPPKISFPTGQIGRESADYAPPDFSAYKVVVIQQPHEWGWFKVIEDLQREGVRVLYEIDDYLHGIRKMEDHGFSEKFTKELLGRAEAMMRMSDGLICSTEFIAKRYRKFNENTWVCPNGIDPKRYDLTRPSRETVNIGWAGGTGHRKAMTPWLQQVIGIMAMRPETCFVSIGLPFARTVQRALGEDRGIVIPFAPIELYPGAMTMFDIALAPAGKGSFFRGKSDLRWLEAGALGIPTIADPMVYPDITDSLTGFHAADEKQAAVHLNTLIQDEWLRHDIGQNVREHVLSKRAFPDAAQAWVNPLT